MRSGAATADAPPPAGPYSQSTRIGGIVAAAGQVGRLPDGTMLSGVAAQTRQAIANLFAVLAASGARQGDVLSVRVFLADMADFDVMNTVYAAGFMEPYPARTTVQTGLRPSVLVEIDALAVVRIGEHD